MGDKRRIYYLRGCSLRGEVLVKEGNMTPELRKALESLVEYYYSHNMSFSRPDGEDGEIVSYLPARYQDMNVIRDELRKIAREEKEQHS